MNGYKQYGILLSNKREQTLVIRDNMDEPRQGILLAEIFWKEKDKYCMISFIC